ncbi:hypothetical protein [Terricaulis silvestris]|uniref:Uncharacterized protein n=1 Tax=Terricaulis silvestris TaxID=2686094 RepID=A0A6I6MSF9_9CAUL|nr:hypothetical protein [Terricaulis silvestris]QGZ96278.1 hypothetical protein DSM104635_03136 [Terricaulis silvestris]
MKKFFSYAVLAAAVLASPTAAFAGDNVADRTAAIRLCRAEVVAQTGAETGQVRLDQVNVRARLVRVDFDYWRNGDLQNIRCEVTRGEPLAIASITPTLQTAAVAQ